MKAARTVTALAATLWWLAYLKSDGSVWYLIAALTFTAAWSGLALADGNHRVDQMVDPRPEDPES